MYSQRHPEMHTGLHICAPRAHAAVPAPLPSLLLQRAHGSSGRRSNQQTESLLSISTHLRSSPSSREPQALGQSPGPTRGQPAWRRVAHTLRQASECRLRERIGQRGPARASGSNGGRSALAARRQYWRASCSLLPGCSRLQSCTKQPIKLPTFGPGGAALQVQTQELTACEWCLGL